MKLRVPRFKLRLPMLTPASLRVVLLVNALVLIAVIIAAVPARYDQSVERKRPVFVYKQKPQTLAPNVQELIKDAYNTELTMLSRYYDTVNQFGLYGPYSAIIESEQVQLRLLQELAQKYKVTLPTDRPEKIKLAAYAGAACVDNIRAENEKIIRYKTMILPRSEEYPEVFKIFNFSLNLAERGHLKVLQRCR